MNLKMISLLGLLAVPAFAATAEAPVAAKEAPVAKATPAAKVAPVAKTQTATKTTPASSKEGKTKAQAPKGRHVVKT
jgi:hypothetical protein